MTLVWKLVLLAVAVSLFLSMVIGFLSFTKQEPYLGAIFVTIGIASFFTIAVLLYEK